MTGGEQRRSFVYIEDVYAAFLAIMNRPSDHLSSETDYDVGTREMHSVCELVEAIRVLTNSQSKLVFGALPYHQNEVMTPTCDPSPLLKLGWEPKVGLSEGLAKTIKYITEHGGNRS